MHHSIRPEQQRGSREQLAADGERSGAPASLDPQSSFNCQHRQEPGKPKAQFQGYVILRTCKPGRLGPQFSDLVTLFEKQEGAAIYVPETPPTVPAPNEAARRYSVSPFVYLIFHPPEFPRFHSRPKDPIH